MKTKKYKFSIYGYGGEYSFGTIEDETLYNELVELADTEGLSPWGNEVGDYEINFYDYEDIVHSFGSSYGNSNIYMSEIIDENNKTEEKEITGFSGIELKEPTIQENKRDGVFGFFGGVSFEKGSFGEFELEIQEDFNPQRLIFGNVSMDSILSGDEIIEKVFYLTKEKVSDEELENKLDEILSNSELEFLKDFEVFLDFENSDTRGKDSMVILFDKNGNTIFED
jgi:hypothetical protein